MNLSLETTKLPKKKLVLWLLAIRWVRKSIEIIKSGSEVAGMAVGSNITVPVVSILLRHDSFYTPDCDFPHKYLVSGLYKNS